MDIDEELNKITSEDLIEDERMMLLNPEPDYESKGQEMLKKRLDYALEESYYEGRDKVMVGIVKRMFSLGYKFEQVKEVTNLSSLRLKSVMNRLGIKGEA